MRVTTSDSQVPSYIAPPSAVANSDSVDSIQRSNNRNLPSGSGVVQFSPPLPMLKKMEDEHDNPFRPDDELYHEVDPIVEVYKKHPFPPGDHSLIDGVTPGSPQEQSLEKGGKWKFGKKKEKANGSAGVEESPVKPSHINLQLEATPSGLSEKNSLSGEAHKATLTSPKAGKVELVHLEDKKRKCGCCTIQ